MKKRALRKLRETVNEVITKEEVIKEEPKKKTTRKRTTKKGGK